VHWLPLGARIVEDFVMLNRDEQRSAAMAATLKRIKAAAEAERLRKAVSPRGAALLGRSD
jgi:hypothetical protein